MALVNVINMGVLDNPTCFNNPFQFEITFECLQELEDDLEWKVLYVGSAHDSHKDQVLDEILVGPVPVGVNKFVLQADAPDPSQLPPDDILGVTVVLVTCSYQEREFLRIGYYVNNEYTLAPPAPLEHPATPREGQEDDDDDAMTEAPPPPPQAPLPSWPQLDLNLVQRHILADKPRVTKFPIPWGNNNTANTMTMEAANDTQADQSMLLASPSGSEQALSPSQPQDNASNCMYHPSMGASPPETNKFQMHASSLQSPERRMDMD